MAKNPRKSVEDSQAGTQTPTVIRLIHTDRVLEIQRALTAFFADASTPAPDLGLRDLSLLDSAVSRQFTDTAEGTDPLRKASILLQGIFDELPFHDANAQVALLTVLLHLDENGFIPNRVSFDEIRQLLEALSEHRMEQVAPDKPRSPKRSQADETELSMLHRWFEAKTRKEDRRDHPLTLPQLRRLLENRDCSITESEEDGGRFLEVARLGKHLEPRFLGLWKQQVSRTTPLLKIQDVSPAGGLVPATMVRNLREACGLEGDDFYDWPARIDSFLHQYQSLLQKLAGM
jgi:prophage maintenance system killer protein